MVSPRRLYLGFLALLALERGAELAVSSRNARRLLAQGGAEHGRGHYRVMVPFHVAFLLACAAGALLRPAPPRPLLAAGLAAALGAQGLRWWSIATLGDRWTTRVVVLPDAPPVTGGPYRIVRHPNYLAVVVEMAVVPLAYGGLATAVAFSLGNAALLAVRVGVEERALGARWARAFEGLGRLLPSRRGRAASPAPAPEGPDDGT